MSAIIKEKNHEKKSRPRGAATFDRLRKKVQKLQKELQDHHEYLDNCLSYYHGHVAPAQKSLGKTLYTVIKVLNHHFKTLQLSKKKQRLLKELILEKCHNYISLVDHSDVSQEIRDIFSQLNDISYDQTFTEDLNRHKTEMEVFFQEQGLDINLDNITLDDNAEDLMYKILEEVQQAAEKKFNQKQDHLNQQKKSSKEQQKEERAIQLQRLQQKSMTSIYKELAKVFHPDLETSPEKKSEKELLMKQLTTAYSNHDFHELLRLEMEWLSQSKQEVKIRSADSLKIYNSILKDQIAELEVKMKVISQSPKYFPLHSYLRDNVYLTKHSLTTTLRQYEEECSFYEDAIIDLQGEKGEKELHKILSEFEEPPIHMAHLFDFLDEIPNQ